MRTPLFYRAFALPNTHSQEPNIKTGKKYDLPKPLERSTKADKKEGIIASILKPCYLEMACFRICRVCNMYICVFYLDTRDCFLSLHHSCRLCRLTITDLNKRD